MNPVMPVLLDEVQHQRSLEPLHQHDRVAAQQGAEGGEPVGVVERRRAQHPLGPGHRPVRRHHRRGDVGGQQEDGRALLHDDLGRAGRPRAAHPPPVGSDHLGQGGGRVRPTLLDHVERGRRRPPGRARARPAAGSAPRRAGPSAPGPPSPPPSSRRNTERRCSGELRRHTASRSPTPSPCPAKRWASWVDRVSSSFQVMVRSAPSSLTKTTATASPPLGSATWPRRVP